jgi:hypothetical protein
MGKEKATITVDREKLNAAKALLRAKSISETIDTALERLLRTERLRRDVAAYRRVPLDEQELAIVDLPVELDLDDADVDYDALYGGSKRANK